MLKTIFTSYFKIWFYGVQIRVYPIFQDVVSPRMKTGLHHVWKHVITMFEICVHDIWRHIYTMFKAAFCVCRHINKMVDEILYHVWRYVYRMVEDMFTQHLEFSFHVYEDILKLFGGLFT